MQGEALGGASRIFGLERFPSTQRRRERRDGGRGRGARGRRTGRGRRGARKELFHTSYLYFWRHPKGFFIQHKTLKQKRWFFFSSHNTNFSWSPGVTLCNSESRGSRWPSALRRREEGRRDPTDHVIQSGPETGSLLALARRWLGDRPAPRRMGQPCSPVLGGVDRPLLTRPVSGPSHRPCGHTLENSRLGPGLGLDHLHLPLTAQKRCDALGAGL